MLKFQLMDKVKDQVMIRLMDSSRMEVVILSQLHRKDQIQKQMKIKNRLVKKLLKVKETNRPLNNKQLLKTIQLSYKQVLIQKQHQ